MCVTDCRLSHNPPQNDIDKTSSPAASQPLNNDSSNVDNVAATTLMGIRAPAVVWVRRGQQHQPGLTESKRPIILACAISKVLCYFSMAPRCSTPGSGALDPANGFPQLEREKIDAIHHENEFDDTRSAATIEFPDCKVERPKVIFSRKRRQVIVEFATFHFLPVIITGALLGLYLGQVFWTPPWPETNVLNALQFAAKIHEATIVASLSCILLHNIRYRLIKSTQADKRGVPLGLIGSPFQLSSPGYLFSAEFKTALSFQDAQSLLLVFYVFALATAAGPSSAIAMLPKLDFWPFPLRIWNNEPGQGKFFDAEKSLPHYYVQAHFDDIFPESINASFSPTYCSYTDYSLTTPSTCPRSELEEIFGGMPAITGNAVRGKSAFNISVQMQDLRQALPRTLYGATSQSFALNPGNNRFFSAATGYATTPADFPNSLTSMMLSSLSGFGRQTRLGDQPRNWPVQMQPYAVDLETGRTLTWKQPVVFTACSQAVSNEAVPLPESDEWPFAFVERTAGGIAQLSINLTMSSIPASLDTSGVAFMDPSGVSGFSGMDLSSVFLARTAKNITTMCLIAAKWIDSDLSISTARSTLLPEFAIEEPDLSLKNNTDGPVLILDVDWLNNLDVGTDPSFVQVNSSYFRNMTRFCTTSSSAFSPVFVEENLPIIDEMPPRVECLSTGISLLIAEGLAKLPYNYALYGVKSDSDTTLQALNAGIQRSVNQPFPGEVNFTSEAQLRNFTRLSFNVTHNVYAYGFRSVTTYLAFSVLLLHVLTVFIHISIIVLGEKWSSRAWSGLGELFVLALQSPSSSWLAHTGGGVTKGETWRLRATVEDFASDNRAGIVVRHKVWSDPGREGGEAEPECKPILVDRIYS